MRRTAVSLAILLLTLAPALAADAVRLVVCAPGFPSDTEEAQETMDHFASVVERAAGIGPVAAVYHPTLDGGLAALERETPALAIVPLPFHLAYRQRFDLRPLARVVQPHGPEERWSLVARAGAVGGPQDLTGWRIAGMPGYAPAFVTAVALAGWDGLPADVEIEFVPRVLSLLRRAARGESLAVLLDGAQAEALGSLPFAADLELLARSEPLPGVLLCGVGDALDEARTRKLTGALLRLHELDAGLLNTMRIERFESLEPGALDRWVRTHDAAVRTGR